MEQQPRPDPMTKSYIADLTKKKLALSKEKQLLAIETMHAVALFQQQQQPNNKKKSKKRPASKPEAAVAAPPEPVAKKEKKHKVKPEGWLCVGNVVSGEPCPLDQEAQKFTGRLRHNNKLTDVCKACKKAVKAAAAASFE